MIIIIKLYMAKYKQNHADDCGHTVGIAPPSLPRSAGDVRER